MLRMLKQNFAVSADGGSIKENVQVVEIHQVCSAIECLIVADDQSFISMTTVLSFLLSGCASLMSTTPQLQACPTLYDDS